ncbi:MAG: DUF4440 domain-containing protein, partial [Opitutaceae bacterium]|nr:DUF4440 domain-containing protein [Opitutaceae bacterium]
VALISLAAVSRVAAAETRWSPAQAEVAARVKAWEVASLAGDADAIMNLTAPGFMGWDLAKPEPIDRTAYREEGVAFFAQFEVLECALPVTAIQIDGETAAAYGRYFETVQDATGARMKLQGSWTASLLRRGKQWLFFSLSTLADRPATDEAAIKREVAEAMRALLAAFSRSDIEAVLSYFADDPDFRAINDEGKVSNATDFRKSNREFFANVVGETIETRSQSIRVIDTNTAVLSWHGGFQTRMKDGTTLQCDSYGATFVFGRTDRGWKILSDHESGAPLVVAGTAGSADAIGQEITRTLAAFENAVEKVDLGAVLALAADVPEFRYVMPDGVVTDFAGWKQGHIDYFATVSAHRLTEKSQQITVLAPDTAQVTWLGTMDIVPKDGPVQRVDPFAATFLFKRIGGAWKLVAQHESGPQPRPIAAVVTPAGAAIELRRADAELVAAANDRDLERWLACFEDDATLLPPSAPPIAGKDAIRPAAAGLMKCPDFAVAHTITAVEMLRGDTSAWVTYDFVFTANGEDGRPMTERGTDRTLYRKGPDGRWRVLVDSWQVDAPRH